MKIYLASPLGFSPEYGSYRKRVTTRLELQGHTVFDTWEQQTVDERISQALAIKNQEERQQAIATAAAYAGQVNAGGIQSAVALLAVLDGTEPDSGTMAELGYALRMCQLMSKPPAQPPFFRTSPRETPRASVVG